jgi:hypothetical protein
MKKIGVIIILGLFVVSGIGASAISHSQKEVQHHNMKIEINVSDIEISTFENYISISIPSQTSFMMEPGKPMLPIISKTFILPIGTKILSISLDIESSTVHLPKKIIPSPAPQVGLMPSMDNSIHIDHSLYERDEFYPLQEYSIRKGAGIANQDHVLYVVVDCYAQYNPKTDIINIPQKISVDYSYRLPTNNLLSADQYDLFIITDETLTDEFTPLVQHKNDQGVRTIMETVQDILPHYDGRDDAEDIKLRIKDAIEEWGISYVLLAGGRVGQSYDFYVPSRRSNNVGSGWESGYASDLYFADIYKIVDNELVFDDWDPNNNGIFAEYSGFIGSKDSPIDYYHDV